MLSLTSFVALEEKARIGLALFIMKVEGLTC